MKNTLEYTLFGDCRLGHFIEEKAKRELDKHQLKIWEKDEVGEIIVAYYNVIFETAFSLGQLFDVADPAVRAHIDGLIQEMKEKKALPLFPRGRGQKGGSHAKEME